MVTLYSDGGYRMHEHLGAWAWCLVEGDQIISEGSDLVRDSTSNRCEYLALINGLTFAVGKYSYLTCVSDSQLLVNQLNGVYKVKDEHIKQLYRILVGICEKFECVRFVWHEREGTWNQFCDKMCDEIIDRALLK